MGWECLLDWYVWPTAGRGPAAHIMGQLLPRSVGQVGHIMLQLLARPFSSAFRSSLLFCWVYALCLWSTEWFLFSLPSAARAATSNASFTALPDVLADVSTYVIAPTCLLTVTACKTYLSVYFWSSKCWSNVHLSDATMLQSTLTIQVNKKFCCISLYTLSSTLTASTVQSLCCIITKCIASTVKCQNACFCTY